MWVVQIVGVAQQQYKHHMFVFYTASPNDTIAESASPLRFHTTAACLKEHQRILHFLGTHMPSIITRCNAADQLCRTHVLYLLELC
jgi:hypothetical protein